MLYVGKSKATFFINKNCNSKNLDSIIEYCNCKKEYVKSIQLLNNRFSLYKSIIRLPENRKFHVSKHLNECSNGNIGTC